VDGIKHGGSFVIHAQKGISTVVDRPTTFGGVRMGEGFAPELVTVTPLTRGTGNQSGPTVGSGGRFGAGQPIVIENIIMKHFSVLLWII
jgi:hypothetical protein